MAKENKKEGDLMDKIVSLAKRRGFVFPGSEIYGGLANSWDFGPLGVELKNNIKKSWWNFFVYQRDDMYGLDAAIIMNPKVWKASGHLENFSDPMIECTKCHVRFRASDLNIMDGGGSMGATATEHDETTKYMMEFIKDPISAVEKYPEAAERSYWVCQNCNSKNKITISSPKKFNLMFQTFIGPAEGSSNIAYLRPETAQAIFVDFKQIMDSFSPKLPFGIAQIGKSFRNEITPGNFIFRTREFEQMEIEYFINPKDDWSKWFEYWLESMKGWMKNIGLDMSKISYLEVPDDERAHYSKRTVDIEFDFPFGKKELYGLAYRGDFDLKNHQEASGQNMEYFDQETKEKFLPHVIEPSLGVERTLLAILASAYREEKIDDKETRVYLDFDIKLSPFKAAVFPLMANKPELVNKAKEIYSNIKSSGIVPIAFDDGGNVGKRYRRQDEIGTPYCFTVDFQTLEDGTVTVRDRNTMKQERISIDSVNGFLSEKIK